MLNKICIGFWNNILRFAFGTFNIFKVPIPNLFMLYLLSIPLMALADVKYIGLMTYEQYLFGCTWEFGLVIMGYFLCIIIQKGRAKYKLNGGTNEKEI